MTDLNPFAYPTDLQAVYKAMRFAKKAHRGLTRWDESPAFHHLLSVASRCAKHGRGDTQTLIVALLHDVVEDTSVSLTMVHDVFGLEVATAVDFLTQRKGESRDDYFTRCMGSDSDLVYAVKFSDRCDNVAGLHTCPDLPEYGDHVENYFYELEKYFLPHLDRVPTSLAKELVALTNRAREYYDKPPIDNVVKLDIPGGRPLYQRLEEA